jgi:hypothetical protein
METGVDMHRSGEGGGGSAQGEDGEGEELFY